MGLYVLLLTSAGIAMWSSRTPGVPGFVTAASPFVFLAFAVGFSAYRLALVMARRYSAFKAFVQISLAALFFMLLLFPRVEAVVAPSLAAGVPVAPALVDPDPRVRALAAEVAGWRADEKAASALVGLLDDADPQVRASAHGALVRLNAGADLGTTPSGWKERFP